MYIITGSTGLIGFSTCEYYLNKKKRIIGIDNDLRKYFFGLNSSNKWKEKKLKRNKNYLHYSVDIRNKKKIFEIFRKYKKKIKAVIHTAAQPHDWAAKEPFTDFDINANGTLNLLEALRNFCPDAPFVFTSTNKVYGDAPNFLPLKEKVLGMKFQKIINFLKKGLMKQCQLTKLLIQYLVLQKLQQIY